MKALSFLHSLLISFSGKRLHEKTARLKQTLFEGLSGTVVEIGAGAGENIALLPAGVSRYVAVEPNPFLCETLVHMSKTLPCGAEVVQGVAESMPFENGYADAVICTFVLCSVRDQKEALAEIIRVLKPGGSFVFIEHVAAPQGTFARMVQKLGSPFSRRFCGGCQWHRDTGAAIHNAAFNVVNIMMEPFLQKFSLAPTIAGYCFK